MTIAPWPFGDTPSADPIVTRLRALADGSPTPSRPIQLDDPALAHPRLRDLVDAFQLDIFETLVLLLAIGAEIDPQVQALCARCHGDDNRRNASFRLATALFSAADAHAYTPSGPLRHWGLIEIETTRPLLDAAIHISEFALHWLCGRPSRDALLAGTLEPLHARPRRHLAASHRVLAAQLAQAARLEASAGERPQILQLIGPDAEDTNAVALATANILRRAADTLTLDALFQAGDRATLARWIRRDHALTPTLLLVTMDDRALAEDRATALSGVIRRLSGPIVLSYATKPDLPLFASPMFTVETPTRKEQFAQWKRLLGKAAEPVEPMLARFDMRFGSIETAYRTAAATRKTMAKKGSRVPWRGPLSAACRELLRGSLDAFADRIDTRGVRDDLILPPSQRAQFDAIIADVGNQTTVLDRWAAGGGSRRGLGLTALFSGPSGSGKTTGAEVLATALDLDLYRIDLSAVVSKYIGETEKHLSLVFDAAARGANLLFFDEGDALFGKRTEVRDSHDRYANQGVSFLLQKLESHPGLTVLASNLADSMDTAFLRRFRYVVEFPLPGPVQREAIWRQAFDDRIVSEGIDFARLARLTLTGGAIRNVALRAAFLATANGGRVTMEVVYAAARDEYRKLHKIMTEDESGGDDP